MNVAPVEPLAAEYQKLVRELLAPRQVTVAPAEMVARFQQLLRTASPETVTTPEVLGLVAMGTDFLAAQERRADSGELPRGDFEALRGQFRGGARILLDQASWLEEVARQALEGLIRGRGPAAAGGEAPAPPAAPSGLRRDRQAPPRDLLAARYRASQEHLERALKVIPLASQTVSKSLRDYPRGATPLFLERGEGALVWDVDGNRYVDLVNALLPVSLGYCDPDVDAAIATQLARGISLTLPTALEAELAELLVEIIPCAEMVRFGKNGADATGAAIRIARAATGRDRIAACGYHGYHDWYIGATRFSRGVPAAVRALTGFFQFNDLESLDRLLAAHPGEFAAVILEPMRGERPADGFLAGCLELAHRHGALLIFDEIITGFRLALGGAQALFGVTPDLATFGKSVANGMPLSAVVGPRDLMREVGEEIYFSTTYGGENLSLAAALATVRKMLAQPVIETLWTRGARLNAGVESLLARHRLGDRIQLRGAPCWMLLEFHEGEGATAAHLRALLLQELLLRGVLVSWHHSVSYALSEAQVDEVIAAYDGALAEVAAALAEGDLPERLAAPQEAEGRSLRALAATG